MHKTFGGLLLAAAFMTATSAGAADEAVLTRTQKILSERLAVEAAQAAIDFCAASNVHVHVIIMDADLNLRLLLIGDGSKVNTTDGARRKAYTAATMGQATAVIAQRLADNPKMLVPPDATLLFLPGGIPIRAGGELIGSIGVGGGAPEQDAKCAQAGLDKIQSRLQ
jgi:uncharacterized protein GlcG (DUF336 family)